MLFPFSFADFHIDFCDGSDLQATSNPHRDVGKGMTWLLQHVLPFFGWTFSDIWPTLPLLLRFISEAVHHACNTSLLLGSKTGRPHVAVHLNSQCILLPLTEKVNFLPLLVMSVCLPDSEYHYMSPVTVVWMRGSTEEAAAAAAALISRLFLAELLDCVGWFLFILFDSVWPCLIFNF